MFIVTVVHMVTRYNAELGPIVLCLQNNLTLLASWIIRIYTWVRSVWRLAGNSSAMLSHNVISLHPARHVISSGSGQGSVHIALFHGHLGDETLHWKLMRSLKEKCKCESVHRHYNILEMMGNRTSSIICHTTPNFNIL